MAGSQIATSVTIINSLLGFQAVSLTNMDSDSAPQIAAGSKVEIASSFFTFGAAETIDASTWSAISTANAAYIMLVPAGTAGSQTVTAQWTTADPVWSTAKQGFYASAGSVYRVIGGCYKWAASTYRDKFVLPTAYRGARETEYVAEGGTVSTVLLSRRIVEIGEWNMDSDPKASVDTGVDEQKVRLVQVVVHVDSDEDYIEASTIPSRGNLATGYTAYWTWDADANPSNRGRIVIAREAGGLFDGTRYDETGGYNRGWVTLEYEL